MRLYFDISRYWKIVCKAAVGFVHTGIIEHHRAIFHFLMLQCRFLSLKAASPRKSWVLRRIFLIDKPLVSTKTFNVFDWSILCESAVISKFLISEMKQRIFNKARREK